MEFELSMYQHGSDNLKEMKRSMQLDFAPGNTKQTRAHNLIGNQELNMLKLASPELEKMLITQNGMIGTTPTPTQFAYPKHVTDEQEAYARGFVNALADLHHTPDGDEAATTSNNSITSIANQPHKASAYSVLNPMPSAMGMISQANNMQPGYGIMPGYTTHSSISRANPPFAPSGLTVPNSMPQMPVTSYPTNVKTEPVTSMFGDHTVPESADSSRFTDSPLDRMSNDSAYDHVENLNRLDSIPVDLEEQEKIKLERKRARNRIAARKCRTRKLDRITRLENKVTDLKDRNNDLSQSAHTLQDQVVKLKQQIIEHMKSGCQIMLPEMNGMNMNGSGMHPHHHNNMH